jgi:hypothetical protein
MQPLVCSRYTATLGAQPLSGRVAVQWLHMGYAHHSPAHTPQPRPARVRASPAPPPPSPPHRAPYPTPPRGTAWYPRGGVGAQRGGLEEA